MKTNTEITINGINAIAFMQIDFGDVFYLSSTEVPFMKIQTVDGKSCSYNCIDLRSGESHFIEGEHIVHLYHKCEINIQV